MSLARRRRNRVARERTREQRENRRRNVEANWSQNVVIPPDRDYEELCSRSGTRKHQTITGFLRELFFGQ